MQAAHLGSALHDSGGGCSALLATSYCGKDQGDLTARVRVRGSRMELVHVKRCPTG
jgi:hypothetical protein